MSRRPLGRPHVLLPHTLPVGGLTLHNPVKNASSACVASVGTLLHGAHSCGHWHSILPRATLSHRLANLEGGWSTGELTTFPLIGCTLFPVLTTVVPKQNCLYLSLVAQRLT